MKTVTVLGSTGSIGSNTLGVIKDHPKLFRVKALAAHSQIHALADQINFFKPEFVFLKDRKSITSLAGLIRRKVRFFSEEDGLRRLANEADADILVAATNGTSALGAVLDAIDKSKRIALANKEIIVMAGALVMNRLKNSQARLIPIDSEHSAIFQCLMGHSKEGVQRLILTGTGGPLREVKQKDFSRISMEKVINHPKWKMGKKISVDSATLMNKGLEIIEASWLFDIPVEKIDVLIHPEAIIHSMVEFRDGSILAQMGVTDMRGPIRYALSFPERLCVGPSMRLNSAQLKTLSFCEPDRKKFPCLELAIEAAKKSGSAPCVLSASDEVAVEAFLSGNIDFSRIPRVIEKVMSLHQPIAKPSLCDIESTHDWARETARSLCVRKKRGLR